MTKVIRNYILSAIVFSLTIAFFAPLNNYFKNIYEYPFLFNQVFNTVGMLGLMVTGSCLIGPLLPAGWLRLMGKKAIADRWLTWVTTLYTYLALLFWLQGTVLAVDVGVLDGRPVAWEQYQLPIIINSVIWVGLLLVLVAARRRVQRLVVPVALGLLLMQLGNFVSQLATMPPPLGFKQYVTNAANQSSFSTDKNVVMILLDTFQSDVFEQVTYDYPEIKKRLAGFTYYRNVIGSYPTTAASIPLLMTGRFYQNDRPYQDYITEAYLAESLPKKLKGMEYNVHIPCSTMFLCSAEVSDAVVEKPKQTWLTKAELSTLLKPTIIRYLPSGVYMAYQKNKTQINDSISRDLTQADNSQAIYDGDQQLLQAVIGSAATDSAQPAFRFYHFAGAHPPFSMDQTGSYSPQRNNYDGFVIHAAGSFSMAEKVMESLKDLGIYDQTMIIILADHGYGPMGYKVNPEDSQVSDNKVIGAAMPLLLIKPFHSSSPYAVDDTPISYKSVAGDIVNYLETGILSMTAAPVRHFYFYDWDGDWKAAYLPEMTPYEINGPVRDPKSWSKAD